MFLNIIFITLCLNLYQSCHTADKFVYCNLDPSVSPIEFMKQFMHDLVTDAPHPIPGCNKQTTLNALLKVAPKIVEFQEPSLRVVPVINTLRKGPPTALFHRLSPPGKVELVAAIVTNYYGMQLPFEEGYKTCVWITPFAHTAHTQPWMVTIYREPTLPQLINLPIVTHMPFDLKYDIAMNRTRVPGVLDNIFRQDNLANSSVEHFCAEVSNQLNTSSPQTPLTVTGFLKK